MIYQRWHKPSTRGRWSWTSCFRPWWRSSPRRWKPGDRTWAWRSRCRASRWTDQAACGYGTPGSYTTGPGAGCRLQGEKERGSIDDICLTHEWFQLSTLGSTKTMLHGHSICCMYSIQGCESIGVNFSAVLLLFIGGRSIFITPPPPNNKRTTEKSTPMCESVCQK